MIVQVALQVDFTSWLDKKKNMWQIYHFKTTFMCPRSTAWVPFDSVRPSTPLGGFLGGAQTQDFRGITFQVDLTIWLVTCQVIWEGAGGECDQWTWQAQLVNLTCQVPLCSNASVGPWLFQQATCFYECTWEGSGREIEASKLLFTLDLIPSFLVQFFPSLPFKFQSLDSVEGGHPGNLTRTSTKTPYITYLMSSMQNN